MNTKSSSKRLAVRQTVNTCAECGQPKPITSFGDGRLLVCAECRTMRGRITSHTDGVYDGAELRPYAGRPGAMRAFDLPSRIEVRRFYRDGRIEEIEVKQ